MWGAVWCGAPSGPWRLGAAGQRVRGKREALGGLEAAAQVFAPAHFEPAQGGGEHGAPGHGHAQLHGAQAAHGVAFEAVEVVQAGEEALDARAAAVGAAEAAGVAVEGEEESPVARERHAPDVLVRDHAAESLVGLERAAGGLVLAREAKGGGGAAVAAQQRDFSV